MSDLTSLTLDELSALSDEAWDDIQSKPVQTAEEQEALWSVYNAIQDEVLRRLVS